ncbi:hypothetical protein BU17DRAFT_70048 [Hysterangium stoloniferum]|nr:hypothetical protein BU17DRAFT_70048 [Hysterangium stoloniferum]
MPSSTPTTTRRFELYQKVHIIANGIGCKPSSDTAANGPRTFPYGQTAYIIGVDANTLTPPTGQRDDPSTLSPENLKYKVYADMSVDVVRKQMERNVMANNLSATPGPRFSGPLVNAAYPPGSTVYLKSTILTATNDRIHGGTAVRIVGEPYSMSGKKFQNGSKSSSIVLQYTITWNKTEKQVVRFISERYVLPTELSV